MSKYYSPSRARNRFEPGKPFTLSRSKIELFLNCPRCFYLDRRLGIGQPPGFPFKLNSAVDALLKKEFDLYRDEGQPHPLMSAAGLDAVPFRHERLEEWRDSLRRGIRFLHPATGLTLTGGVDDLWVRPDGALIIVDYKATSKDGSPGIDADWQLGYRRQVAFYAWLFRKNGFRVSDDAYFVYCNGRTDPPRFDQRLEFRIVLLPCRIDDTWVEPAVTGAHACLGGSSAPPASPDCDHCAYVAAASAVPL